jgi:hypothetical protein
MPRGSKRSPTPAATCSHDSRKALDLGHRAAIAAPDIEPEVGVDEVADAWQRECLDPDQGEVWLDASSALAGIKMLFGMDPKKDYRDHAAKVDLG